MNTFRTNHLLALLKLYETTLLPLDVLLRNYLKLHHAIGSKDRKYIAETLYTLIRFLGLIDYLNGKDTSWQARLKRLEQCDLKKYTQDPTIPPHIRVSFPKSFFEFLMHSLGEKRL